MPHRFLFGPVTAPLPADVLAEAGRAGECLPFGPGGLDLSASDTWADVTCRLPSGWVPDFVVLDLHGGCVPGGLWSAPVPLVALVGDWELGWHYYRQTLPHCDFVLADTAGAELLSQAGLGPALAVAPPDCDPTTRPGSEPDRDIDILYLGDLRPTQRDALPLLGPLADLADRWCVAVRASVSPEADRELLRRARVVLNRGGPREASRLASAAADAGALFLPCPGDALPTVDTLAERLETYLTDEVARRRERGMVRGVPGQSGTPGGWGEALKRATSELSALRDRAARRPPCAEDERLLARTWAASDRAYPDPALGCDLAAAVAVRPSASLHNALGLAAALASAGGGRAGPIVAATHFGRALEADPEFAPAALNRAEALAAVGQTDAAAQQARRALELLERDTPLSPGARDACHYPPGFDVFRVEWERAAWQHAADPAGEDRAKRSLLAWRLHGLLARLGDDLPHRYEAALLRPDLPATRAALGSSLLRAGRAREAVPHLRRAAAANPIEASTARVLYEALGRLGRHEDQACLVSRRRRLARVAPALVPEESWFSDGPPRPAASGVPAGPSRPRVSLCMIVRDEEANLAACLDSVVDLVDEVVVVDTGSADRTREVAARYRARVVEFAWVDSFAAARNESLRHATGEWAFWLDADDRLDEGNRRKLRGLFARLSGGNAAFMMRICSVPDAVTGTTVVVDHARLFRNHPDVRWEYRVHEQILPAVVRQGGSAIPTDIVIHHVGYRDPSLRRAKLERNLRLLRLEQGEHTDDPFVTFKLGALLFDLGRTSEAVPLFRRSIDRSQPRFSLTPITFGLLAQALRRVGRSAEALAACQEGRARYPDEPELLFQEGLLRHEAGELAPAEACFARLLQARPGAWFGETGLFGYKAHHHLALLYRDQGRAGEAEVQWQAAVAERPDFVPAWLGLGELYLAQGRSDEVEGLARRLEVGPTCTLPAAMVRARLDLARREFAAARDRLERCITQAPHALWPREMLCEVLAAEGVEPGAVAQALREVLLLNPNHVQARRQLARLTGESESTPVA
jgi:tetratricopeptide (TPR) repeat protein